RSREQRVELGEALLELAELDAAVDEQVLAELVSAVHLEHQPAEVAQPLLAHREEAPPLAPELRDRREGPADGARRRRRCGSSRIWRWRAAKAHSGDGSYRCGCSPRAAGRPNPTKYARTRRSPTMPTGIPTHGMTKRKMTPIRSMAMPSPIMVLISPACSSRKRRTAGPGPYGARPQR